MSIEVIKFLQSFSFPLLDNIFELITMLGEETFVIVLFGIIYWAIDKKIGYMLGFSVLITLSTASFMKEVLKIPRPFFEEGIRTLRVETATGYSFPSGHSATSASFYFPLAILFKNKFVKSILFLIIILVPISRLYLGVHTIWDVIFGVFLGISISIFSFKCFENKTFDKRLLIISIILLIMPFLEINNDILKAIGINLGFIAGYFVEKKHISFNVNVTFIKKIIRVLLGLIGIIIIKSLMKPIFNLLPYSDFCRYFTIGFYATVIWPYIFTKLRLLR